jgi:hypothetical protein
MCRHIVWPGGHTFYAAWKISDGGFYFWSSYYLFYEAASLLTPYKVIYTLYRGCVRPNEGKRRTGEHGGNATISAASLLEEKGKISVFLCLLGVV